MNEINKEYIFAFGQLLQVLKGAEYWVFMFKNSDGVEKDIEAAECWFNEIKKILNKAILELSDKEKGD